MKRRDLLKTAAGAIVAGELASAPNEAAPLQPARAPANDRIGVGLIGVGGMGTSNLRDFMDNPDLDIVAICDIYKTNLQRALNLAGGKAKSYHDYRRLLEDRNVQAVVISTPEHWHAIMCIDACEAGKDVYVEKPLSHHIRDGRLMVEAARRNQRVVQVGTQQRSGAHFQRAVKYVREGRIGSVYYVTCWYHSRPPVATQPPVTGGPPADLDWDLWLGPAPELPYAEVWNVGRRGYWDFFGGNITEWGTHLVDIALWALNVQAPRSVVAAGGRFHRKNGEIPDTLQVTYEYPGFVIQHSILSHNTFGPNGDPGSARFGSYGTQFHGTKGTLFIDRAGFRITPQTTRNEEPNQPPRVTGTPDGRQLGVYYTTEILAEHSDSSAQHWPHVRNFLDCVKSRKTPIADVEDGHYTNTTCRLGNIAYRVGRKIRWDGAKEQVIDDPEANKLVVGTYRAPWKPKGL